MPIVTGVKFRGTGKQYYFAPGQISYLDQGDRVIVETARGRELGEVVSPPHEVEDGKVVGQLKPVLRKAGPADLLAAERHQLKEAEVLVTCQEQVDEAGLKMKIVRGEYNFDGSRLTFFFTSENRVDFRKLVRDLARLFKTRIELRQIGVRDEAKMIGGIGKCGRPLCCSTWLQEFKPVSIRMAKTQDLPLSPMEISGLCGRLLCCLTYEDDAYRAIKKQLPRRGKIIDTPLGPARVVKIKVFDGLAVLRLEDGELIEMNGAQILGDEPFEREEKKDDNGRYRGLDQALQANRSRAAEQVSASRGRSSEQQEPSPTDAPQTSGRSRSRRRSASRRTRSSSQGQQPRAAQGEGRATETSQQGASGSGESRSKSKRRRRRRRPSKGGNRQSSSANSQGGQNGSGASASSGSDEGGATGNQQSDDRNGQNAGENRSGGSRSSSSRRRSRSSSRRRSQRNRSLRTGSGQAQPPKADS